MKLVKKWRRRDGAWIKERSWILTGKSDSEKRDKHHAGGYAKLPPYTASLNITNLIFRPTWMHTMQAKNRNTIPENTGPVLHQRSERSPN